MSRNAFLSSLAVFPVIWCLGLFIVSVHGVPTIPQQNISTTIPQQNISTTIPQQNTSTNITTGTTPFVAVTTTATVECNAYGSSCENCSHHKHCAWCFSYKSCMPIAFRKQRNVCKEDDWYYGDCDKPIKEEILIYVLLSCALFLLLIVILLVMYIFLCKIPRNKDYKPLNTEEKKRKRTPLMSKKVKPSPSRTEELKKKYQLDK